MLTLLRKSNSSYFSALTIILLALPYGNSEAFKILQMNENVTVNVDPNSTIVTILATNRLIIHCQSMIMLLPRFFVAMIM